MHSIDGACSQLIEITKFKFKTIKTFKIPRKIKHIKKTRIYLFYLSAQFYKKKRVKIK